MNAATASESIAGPAVVLGEVHLSGSVSDGTFVFQFDKVKHVLSEKPLRGIRPGRHEDRCDADAVATLMKDAGQHPDRMLSGAALDAALAELREME